MNRIQRITLSMVAVLIGTAFSTECVQAQLEHRQTPTIGDGESDQAESAKRLADHNTQRTTPPQRLSPKDAKQLLDEIRRLRQDVQRLSKLVERRSTAIDRDTVDEAPKAAQNTEASQSALLFFTADWSIPCQQMLPTISRLQSEGFHVRAINVDKDRRLAKQFRVTSIPCYVALDEGNEIDRLSGVATEPELRRLLAKLRKETAPRHNQVTAALEKPVTVNCEDTPLSQALQRLSRQVKVQIALDPSVVVERGTNPEPSISLVMDGISCRSALRLMVEPHNLLVCVREDIVVVTGKPSESDGLMTFTYPIREILIPDLDETESEVATNFANAVCLTISPDSWRDFGGFGSMRFSERTGNLIVRQTAVVHSEIANRLKTIRDSRERGQYRSDSLVGHSVHNELELRTYSVWDLITVTQDEASPKPVIKVDTWLNLIERVKSPVDPKFWEDNGGQCSIRPHEQTLSLVIRADPDSHERISRQLQLMRGRQDLIICETEYLLMSNESLLGINGLELTFDPKSRAVVLNEFKARKVLNAVREGKGKVLESPGLRTLNGGIAEHSINPAGNDWGTNLHLHLRGRITSDRRELLLNVAFNSGDVIAALSSNSYRVPHGEFLILDRTEEFQRGRAEKPPERFLVLIHPSIRPQELTDLQDEFDNLFQQHRFVEAEVVARKAQSLIPKDPAADTMYWKAVFCRCATTIEKLRPEEEEAFWMALDVAQHVDPIGIEEQDVANQEFAKLVEEFKDLFQKKRFAESDVVARKAKALKPMDPVAEAMYWRAITSRRTSLDGKSEKREETVK